jgi:hypothetical protein
LATVPGQPCGGFLLRAGDREEVGPPQEVRGALPDSEHGSRVLEALTEQQRNLAIHAGWVGGPRPLGSGIGRGGQFHPRFREGLFYPGRMALSTPPEPLPWVASAGAGTVPPPC